MKFSVDLVAKEIFLPFLRRYSKMILEINKAANNEVRIPITKV